MCYVLCGMGVPGSRGAEVRWWAGIIQSNALFTLVLRLLQSYRTHKKIRHRRKAWAGALRWSQRHGNAEDRTNWSSMAGRWGHASKSTKIAASEQKKRQWIKNNRKAAGRLQNKIWLAPFYFEMIKMAFELPNWRTTILWERLEKQGIKKNLWVKSNLLF